MTERKRNQKEEGSELHIFNVPFDFREIKENITITTNTSTQSTKEEIINKAIKFHSEGNLLEAAKYYQIFIDKGFRDPRVYSNYGVICKQFGEVDKAISLYKKGVSVYLNDPELNSNLGNLLCDIGEIKEAKAYISKAIKIKPNLAEAHSNLGRVLNELNEFKEAELSFKKAIEINPDFAGAYSNLGNILKDSGNLKEAEICLRKSLKLNPNISDAHLNLGSILKVNNRLEQAEISTRRAIKIYPNFAQAYSNLGSILNSLGKLKEAELCLRKAIELDSNLTIAYLNLGSLLKDLGNLKESLYAHEKALSKDPKNGIIILEILSTLLELSQWDEIEKYIKILKKIELSKQNFNPLKFSYFEDNPYNFLKRAQNFFNNNHNRNAANISHRMKEKTHIGYFSADFHAHPVMYLIGQIIENHDESKFNIFIYSFTKTEDKYTKDLKDISSNFRYIENISDQEVLEIARNDELDIAIDLMGYTANNRMSIFSYRLAPIQISYLGYPGTTGSNRIDYLIADKITIPSKYKKFYSEKIIYMPNSFMPFDNKKKIADKVFSRKDFKFNEGSFVLAAFHKNIKITPREILIWSSLLKKIPHSILWLSNTNKVAKSNLLILFNRQGVDSNRIYFAERLHSFEEHLSRHQCADLFIDTFNYNGHSTVIDSLWAGLPVVTLLGQSFCARVSGSLLNTLELNELIAHNTNEYEKIIIELSRNPKKILDLKKRLILLKKNNPLFNSKQKTKDLENIYLKLVKDSS